MEERRAEARPDFTSILLFGRVVFLDRLADGELDVAQEPENVAQADGERAAAAAVRVHSLAALFPVVVLKRFGRDGTGR